MRYLLDTCVWLWSLSNPERLSREAHNILADRQQEVFLSAVTSWEIVTKVQANKLELPEPPSTYVPSRMAAQGFWPLEVSHPHALAVSRLPAYHRDPFDRLLVAQAQVEDLVLITADIAIKRYPVSIIWAGK